MQQVADKDGIVAFVAGDKPGDRTVVLIAKATPARDASSAKFELGDRAVYGGYNFLYWGTIVSIGPKTVTIDDDGERKRLKHADFAFWNRRAARGEADTSFTDWLACE